MKKIGIIILVLMGIVFLLLILRGDEDIWICQKGEWVKHGSPSAEKPEQLCEEEKNLKDLIKLDSIQPNDKISSPLLLKGQARGTWYFEGDFPVILTNWDGLIIAEGYAMAQSDWMTEDLVQFEGELQFDKPDYGEKGFLILKKDDYNSNK